MPHHGSKPAPSGQPPTPPSFQFRDPTVPGGLLEMLCAHRVSQTEFLLAIMIDAYVKRGGPGCYASNRHLAEKLGVTVRCVQQGIQSLIAKAVVVRIERDGVRYLEASWSRILDDSPEDARYTSEPVLRDDTGTNVPMKPGFIPPMKPGFIQKVKAVEKMKGAGAATPPPASPDPVKPQTPTNRRRGNVDEPRLVVNTAALASPNDRVKRSNPVDEDFTRASRLRDHVRSKGRLVTRSRRRWAEAFRRLRVSLEGDAASTIDDVLNWYIATDPPKPLIRDGDQFRTCFTWLHDLYLRAPKPVVLPERDERWVAQITKDLRAEYHWPMGSADQLADAVRLSYARYRDWLAPVIRAAAGPRGPVAGFAGHLRDTLGFPPQFVRDWFRNVSQRVANWADWSGRLDPFVFNPEHRDFVARLRGAAASYAGDARFYDRFQKEVSGVP